MPRIGIILSGCAGKGPYEIGCMDAIIDYFKKESICCISSASLGGLIGQCFGTHREEQLVRYFKELDTGKYGRYILSFTTNKETVPKIKSLLAGDNDLCYEHYCCIWNLSRNKAEYIPFHTLSEEQLIPYMLGAMAVPMVSTGTIVNGDRILDGAFLDNIPVKPLLDKDLDYIFCIYFDNHRYFLENEEFDRKVIKLFDFPNQGRFDLIVYRLGSYDEMYQYGYGYASRVIRKIFADPDPEAVYRAIEEYENADQAEHTKRLTADVVLNNINVMTKRFFKSDLKRKKK